MIEAEFRRRTREDEDVDEILKALLYALGHFPKLWRETDWRKRVQIDRGTGESASCDLTPYFVPEVQGAVGFASRLPGAIRDAAMCDDDVTLRFVNRDHGLFSIIEGMFRAIISGFGCYRASLVTDIDMALDDSAALVTNEVKTEKETDDRFAVSRFYPINFFDEFLCKRAFGVSANELVKRLKPMCKRAELINSGAFLIFTHEILTGDDLRALDAKARALLVGS